MKFLNTLKLCFFFCFLILISSFTKHKENSKKIFNFKQFYSAPKYPGCSGTNEELKKCLNESLALHITENFNKDVYKNIELSPGRVKIYSQIKITKTGSIEILEVKAPHKNLETEARRVLKLIPNVIPEKHHGKPVEVIQLIPISFIVE